MRTIACDATTFDIALPACASVDPADYSAEISRDGCKTYVLALELLSPPAPAPPIFPTPTPADLTLRISLPATRTQGVWCLAITTPCGCYRTSIFLYQCALPAFVGTHDPTRTPLDTVDCTPAIQPDLNAPNPVLGFTFARTDTHTGVDLTDPAYGAVLLPAPTPALTTLQLGAPVADPLAFAGTLAPMPAALDTLGWRLLDAHGYELAHGALAIAAGVATLSATLAAPLGCGKHYLAIDTP